MLRVRIGLSWLVAVALLSASCGGRQIGMQTDRGRSPARAVTLPDPVPALPAFRISLERPLRQDALRRLEHLPEVAVAAPVATRRVTVKASGGKTSLRVAAVDPSRFRAIAPQLTKDADFVWAALFTGKAVLTFEAARRLGLGNEPKIDLAGRGLEVGALADNGAPNLADILVTLEARRELRLPKARVVIVGASPGASLPTLARSLKARLPSARLHRLAPKPEAPAPPEPVGLAHGGVIGAMSFRILKNGFIEPDPAWVAANIVSGEVPLLGTVRCHRLMFPQLAAALAEIEREGLADEINPADYGGCYVPRFIDRDPRRALSMHAFGLAIDINVSENHLGTRGKLDRRVVAIFERWGFGWGGYWSTPDPMHFELTRLVQPR